jgi:hypothetical protein
LIPLLLVVLRRLTQPPWGLYRRPIRLLLLQQLHRQWILRLWVWHRPLLLPQRPPHPPLRAQPLQARSKN